MCWACEEEELFLRYQLELAVARGVMPPGFEPADFELRGLPVPGQGKAGPEKPAPVKSAFKPAASFVCEPADGE